MLTIVSVVCALATAGLGYRAAVLATQISSPAPGASDGPAAIVELAAAATGAGVALWLLASAGLALVCLALRATGRAWRTGEVLVARHAPAMIRRTVRFGAAAGVGASLLVGGAAHATPGSLPDAGAPSIRAAALEQSGQSTDQRTGDASGQGSGHEHEPQAADLGWQPTGTANAPDGPQAATDPGAEGPTRTAEDAGTADHEVPTPSPATDAPADAPTETPHAPATGTTTLPQVGTPTTDEIVVHRGDSLWSIAKRALPTGAPDADVAAASARWYAANVAVIGDSPDLILPGQVLRAPSASSA